ncbi:hypothetical protein ABN028_33135 [Actinopolymorpha sp. B17G11]|uniref:hypothetical protein n=1 Tax=Actinopolymorpha sp. B17G11 TaxID=3160861 RepID=UPI0032E3BAE4
MPLVGLLPPDGPERALFAAEEQRLAPYLVILAPMANDIVDDDAETYGWMAGGWWRTPSHPRNSRIQEHVATMGWFLAHERPWNPYYRDPALEARLDAAIGYYLGLQGPRGAWPVTYEEESLATTGFGMLALAGTLGYLRSISALPDRQKGSRPRCAPRPPGCWRLARTGGRRFRRLTRSSAGSRAWPARCA